MRVGRVRRSQPLWTLAPAIPNVCLAGAAVCHNMDVRKFMLGPAAAAAPVISAGAKGKGGGSTGAVKAKGKGKGSGLLGGTG